MLARAQRASMQPSADIQKAIEQGMKWVDNSVWNHAQSTLPVMSNDKQALIWHSIKGDPNALQSYIIHLGSKQGITDHTGLDKLASDYISTQAAKFG